MFAFYLASLVPCAVAGGASAVVSAPLLTWVAGRERVAASGALFGVHTSSIPYLDAKKEAVSIRDRLPLRGTLPARNLGSLARATVATLPPTKVGRPGY